MRLRSAGLPRLLVAVTGCLMLLVGPAGPSRATEGPAGPSPAASAPAGAAARPHRVTGTRGIALPPSCQVTFGPQDASSIPTVVRQSGPKTVFCFRPGIFRIRAKITAADGDQFIGSGSAWGGSRLTGSVRISTWALLNGLYVHSGDVLKPHLGGRCLTGTECQYSDWLYNVPGGPLRRVLAPCSPDRMAAGTFCLNYAQARLFVHDDPRGGHLEYATTTAAFDGGVDVAITHLSLYRFAEPSHVVNVVNLHDGWVVDDVEAAFNHSCPVGLFGAGVIVENSRFHHNGQMGFCGSGTDGLVANNEVDHNNTLGFDPYWAAAGGRICQTLRVSVVGNYIHDNNATGLWFDCDNDGLVVRDNVVTRNHTGGGRGAGDGIHLGLSCNGTVLTNTANQNDGSGIKVSNSYNMTIGQVGMGNTVSDNGEGGIVVFSVDRKGSTTQYCHTLDDASNAHVVDNRITMAPGESYNGVINRGGNVTGVSFSQNQYRMPGVDCLARRWIWYDGRNNREVSFSTSGVSWQGSYGQDRDGACGQ